MISKQHFRITKDGKSYKYSFCTKPELIENYDKAIADTTQTWICHHRNEQYYTAKELKDLGLYYDCPPCELIFLTQKEHIKIHKNCKDFEKWQNRKNNALKGRKTSMKGKHFSKEHKENISKSLKGRVFSDKHKNALSNAHKGKHWHLVNGKRIWFEGGQE